MGVVEYPVEPEIDGGSIVGGGYAITINNVYFKTDTGYQKYGDGTVYATAAEFNAAFAAGLDEAGKAAWKVDNRQDTPYLQAFLEKVSGDVGVVEAAPGADLKARCWLNSQAQGITLDADKLLGLVTCSGRIYLSTRCIPLRTVMTWRLQVDWLLKTKVMNLRLCQFLMRRMRNIPAP